MNKAINCIWPRAPWEMPQTNKAGAADRSSDLPYHILATCSFLSALHQSPHVHSSPSTFTYIQILLAESCQQSSDTKQEENSRPIFR